MGRIEDTLRKKGLTGLVKHGSVVSLAPARALSSHARRVYREKYQNAYKYPRWIFAFDTLLVGIAAILLAFNLSVFLESYKRAESGLDLELKAPPLIAADETPLELDVRSTDGKRHDGVSLKWELPPWVEIIEAVPKMDADGFVDLGSIRPGETKSSRLLVRIRARAGTKAQIGFVLSQYDPLFFALDYPGSETRLVERSALNSSAVLSQANYPSEASVPVVVRNDGRLIARAVSLRLTKHEGAPDAGFGTTDSFSIGDMAPGERRLIYIKLGQEIGRSIALGWDLQDGAQTVESTELKIKTSASDGVRIENAVFGVDGKLKIDYTSALAAEVWVSCAATSSVSSPWRTFDIAQGSGTVVINETARQEGSACEIIPIDLQTNTLGRQVTAMKGNTIPFSASARYYGMSGDQLGVGSLPPRVGEKTTYWVIWSVGPSESDLQNAEMQTVLPSGVAPTGKFASATPGTFRIEGQTVIWDVPLLPLGGGEKLTFAFEIGIQPTETDAGRILELVGTSSFTAKTKNGLELKAETVGDDTNIHSDDLGRGRGMIVE
ncbi:hypothetical protein HZC53_05295 [Candidatus Uhrbacteria bacterium]|nr:hypothetical protein [Candidatus Uhrbacteria bacterium]